MTYSVPYGVDITQPEKFIPSAETVAEYEGYGREYLLFRIEELQTDLEALSGELCKKIAKNRRVAELLYTARDIVLGYDTLPPSKGEIEANKPSAKRGRKVKT